MADWLPRLGFTLFPFIGAAIGRAITFPFIGAAFGRAINKKKQDCSITYCVLRSHTTIKSILKGGRFRDFPFFATVKFISVEYRLVESLGVFNECFDPKDLMRTDCLYLSHFSVSFMQYRAKNSIFFFQIFPNHRRMGNETKDMNSVV